MPKPIRPIVLSSFRLGSGTLGVAGIAAVNVLDPYNPATVTTGNSGSVYVSGSAGGAGTGYRWAAKLSGALSGGSYLYLSLPGQVDWHTGFAASSGLSPRVDWTIYAERILADYEPSGLSWNTMAALSLGATGFMAHVFRHVYAYHSDNHVLRTTTVAVNGGPHLLWPAPAGPTYGFLLYARAAPTDLSNFWYSGQLSPVKSRMRAFGW